MVLHRNNGFKLFLTHTTGGLLLRNLLGWCFTGVLFFYMFLEIFILFKRQTDSASRALASLHVLFQLGYSFKYRLASYAWSSFICLTEVKLSSILDTKFF